MKAIDFYNYGDRVVGQKIKLPNDEMFPEGIYEIIHVEIRVDKNSLENPVFLVEQSNERHATDARIVHGNEFVIPVYDNIDHFLAQENLPKIISYCQSKNIELKMEMNGPAEWQFAFDSENPEDHFQTKSGTLSQVIDETLVHILLCNLDI